MISQKVEALNRDAHHEGDNQGERIGPRVLCLQVLKDILDLGAHVEVKLTVHHVHVALRGIEIYGICHVQLLGRSQREGCCENQKK